ncbi:MAG: hypothetical protein EAZ07_06190 [Cytophagales bacterium]|nr:MAG: hypothetical protein EAZ07_06190 [Cytophagales bacterium]
MQKILIILLFICIQQNASAQLFRKYALGIGGTIAQGIPISRFAPFNRPIVYEANLLLLTEDNKERFFISTGMGLTSYQRKDSWKAPSQRSPDSFVGFIPKSTTTNNYTITHLNIPLSIGYRIMKSRMLNIYASVGIDVRFQLASKYNYIVKDSLGQILFEKTSQDTPYLKRMSLFTLALGLEHKSKSEKFIYRLEPFLKVDTRKYFEGKNYYYLDEFLSYVGFQFSCFYQLKNK